MIGNLFLLIERRRRYNTLNARTITRTQLRAMRAFAIVLLMLGLSAFRASAMIVGGVSESSTQVSPQAQKAATIAVQKLNTNDGLRSSLLGASMSAPLKLSAVKSVRTQVVAGTNYFFTLGVEDASGKEVDMEMTVWARPWMEDDEAYQVTKAQRVDA